MTEVVEIDADNKPAIELLQPYAQSGNLNFLIGSGASSPAIALAGTIETEINNLIAGGNEIEANKKCAGLIEKIGEVHAKIIAGTDATIKSVVESYSNFIYTVDRILFARKTLLLPRQANIFTTNYDMFLEHAASLLPSVILNDGFDRSPSLSPNFVFAPERFFDRTYRSGPIVGHQVEMPTVNLVKLHGSMSWRKQTETIIFDSKAVTPLTTSQKSNVTLVEEFLEKHFLILPNLRKFHSALMERTYYDLLRIFSKAMDQQNVVLICFGFSFSDEHILDITRRALRNPTSHLIIFSYDVASSSLYQDKFSKQRNVTVFAPIAGSVIDFAELNTILSAVLPAPARVTA